MKSIIVPGLVMSSVLQAGGPNTFINPHSEAHSPYLSLANTQSEDGLILVAKGAANHPMGDISGCPGFHSGNFRKEDLVNKKTLDDWIKYGAVEQETYIHLRNAMMRKAVLQQKAIQEAWEDARSLLGPVNSSVAQLISQVDSDQLCSQISSMEHEGQGDAKRTNLSADIYDVCQKLQEKFPLFEADVPELPIYLQVILGLLFGLGSASILCFIIFKLFPAKRH